MLTAFGKAWEPMVVGTLAGGKHATCNKNRALSNF